MKLSIPFLIALVLSLADVAAAHMIEGRVIGRNERALGGALVSAVRRDEGRKTTVYSDSEGRFRVPVEDPRGVSLLVRHFGYRDGWVPEVARNSASIIVALEVETDEYDLFGSLPANRWFELLRREIPTDEMREEFTRQCTFCHQQGNWATRIPRSNADWEKLLSLMGRMGATLTPETRSALPGIINEAYDPATAFDRLRQQLAEHPLPDPTGLDAVIDEWSMGDKSSVQHDVVVHPDGTVWAVDTTRDLLVHLDPRSGERREFPVPDGGLPLGGVFPESTMPPNADSRVAPHSLQVDERGRIWVTLCLGNRIGIFDPKTEGWEIIEQPEGLYPHTLRFDRKGRAWYTLALSNQVSRIDPETGEHLTIRLPSRTWAQAIGARLLPWALPVQRWLGASPPETLPADAIPPVPYGIDVAPDGSVWFSQLNVSRIGRIDPETLEIEVFDTPFPGPRRLRFDSRGNVWVPGFSASVVMRFDTDTREFRTWKLPILPNGTATPYALNVDRSTDTVWICGTNSDTLLRFDPKTEDWTVYPLPTRVTYTREIDFDEEGNVWTSNSNTPGWQIETSTPQIIRLDPGAAAGAPAEGPASEAAPGKATLEGPEPQGSASVRS